MNMFDASEGRKVSVDPNCGQNSAGGKNDGKWSLEESEAVRHFLSIWKARSVPWSLAKARLLTFASSWANRTMRWLRQGRLAAQTNVSQP
jgi:hypothetical protein